MSLVTVDNLTVTFGGRPVVDRVSFTLDRGETLALVGESGSGKTLSALSLLQLLPQAATCGGRVVVDGQSVIGAGDGLLRRLRGGVAGMVFQEPMTSLNPLKRVGKQIAEAVRLHRRISKQAARVRVVELLNEVGFPDAAQRLDAFPHQLSGGQRQRVMIAMALANDPALLIADEPTTALDVTIQAQILKLLRTLASERGVSVLFATHDLGTAWEICDRITVMYAGQELETAPITDFFRLPMVPYTRMLLDSLPSSGSALRGIAGDVPSLIAPPPGCRFHPRCPRASDLCYAEHPVAREPEPYHQVRCHHPYLQTADSVVA
jgi:oligopeptide/dipeptide ABC transporter ATP-binding protein